MATSLSKNILNFLKDLSSNNNREWFNDHKDEFVKNQQDFENFISDLIEDYARHDEIIAKLSAKKAMMRIYRDIRFSKDKTPYKTNFGASLGMGKGDTKAGHYLHIEPGKSFIASGIYMPEASVLKEIRKEISIFKDDFLKTVEDKNFMKNFCNLDREHELKNIPQGFEKEDPMSEFLKLKSFVGVHPLVDKDVTDKNAVQHFSEIMTSAIPFIDFLNAPFR